MATTAFSPSPNLPSPPHPAPPQHHRQHCAQHTLGSKPSSRDAMGLLSSLKSKLGNRASQSRPGTMHTSPDPLPNHAPPPYSEHNETATVPVSAPTTPNPATVARLPVIASPAGEDDRYAFLSTFDTLFLIDDSSSMRGQRWRECAAAVASIAPICTRYDTDGIDILFLNAAAAPQHSNVRDAPTVNKIFASVQPYGGTPTGQRLDGILRSYLKRYEKAAKRAARRAHSPSGVDGVVVAPLDVKPLNIIVITDGAPTDDVETPLIYAARRLDALDAPGWQVGVQFFQVGDDQVAAAHLRDLDDGLAELAGGNNRAPLRDMIDTVPFQTSASTGSRHFGSYGNIRELSADAILKVVLGAVNRKLDRTQAR